MRSTTPVPSSNQSTAPRLGEIRASWIPPVVLAAATVTFAVLLYVTSYMNFFWDEWDFITAGRKWDLTTLMLPHAEHWSTIPILFWKVLFVTVGIRSHIPYEAGVLAAHVLAVLVLFALVNRRSGQVPAFAASLTFLVLGAGGTDIVWAFQIGFAGAVAFGLLAILILDRPIVGVGRLAAGLGALLCSLMCSAVGLAFFAVLAVELFFDSRRRRWLPSLLIPAGIFGIWFLLYGAGLPGSPGAPCPTCGPARFGTDFNAGLRSLNYLEQLAGFVVSGIDASAQAIFGQVGVGGIVLVPVVGALIVHWFRQRTIKPWQFGAIAGVVAWFALTGLGRAQNGSDAASHSRYVYVGAVFLILLVADAARELRWQGFWRPILVGAFGISLIANVVQLGDRALVDTVPGITPFGAQTALMRVEDAELQTVELFRGAPDMAIDRSADPAIMPQLSVRAYLAAVDELGSPVPQISLASIGRLPPTAVDRVMLNLFGDSLTLKTNSSQSDAGFACQSIDSSAGATMNIDAPSGQPITLDGAHDGGALLSLGFMNPPVAQPFLRRAQLTNGVVEWVHVPDTGRAVNWRLRIQTLAVGALRICSPAPLSIALSANNTYRDEPETFVHDSHWTKANDAAALDGEALMATADSSPPSGAFGKEFVAAPIVYDVWFRVRVSNAAGGVPELILAVVDVTSQRYWTYAPVRPSEVGTKYVWLLIASNVQPPEGHVMKFQLNISDRLSANWYVDAAIMQPTGFSRPSDS